MLNDLPCNAIDFGKDVTSGSATNGQSSALDSQFVLKLDQFSSLMLIHGISTISCLRFFDSLGGNELCSVLINDC